MWPSPVVALKRAIAVGFVAGPAGLAAIDEFVGERQLATYCCAAAARADIVRRLARADEARGEYRRALAFTDDEVERRFLQDRLPTSG